MHDQGKIKFFRRKLLEWFETNKRDFPWRHDTITSYELIFSEILLQRTKAETVAKYYKMFFDRYPNWDEIMKASTSELEEILQPLGLYRQRARRLLTIVEEHKLKNGLLPLTEKELSDSAISTQYLSAAYKLIILKKRAALLDVNMSRVLSRFFEPRKLKDIRDDIPIQQLAQRVTSITKCKELNWSILDFAAMVCTSSNPSCGICVLNSRCSFYEVSNVS
jgi:A/G-specific adenine glycosylase